MDFNLTKKNLEAWAADRMELDKATIHYDLDIFMMIDEATGDEYLTIKAGSDMKLIPLESPIPSRYSRPSHGYGRAPHDIYKPAKRDEEIEEATDD